MNRAEKQVELELLTGKFTGSQLALCAEYRGLTVGQITNLRRELRQSGAVGRVVKCTLARLAVEKSLKNTTSGEAAKFEGMLKGPVMLVFSNDPVGPSKVITKFAKTAEALKIKGGWFEGVCLDKAGVEQLATMPSREEILGKLLALINAPATQLLRLMQAPAEQTVRVIDAQRQKIETAGK